MRSQRIARQINKQPQVLVGSFRRRLQTRILASAIACADSKSRLNGADRYFVLPHNYKKGFRPLRLVISGQKLEDLCQCGQPDQLASKGSLRCSHQRSQTIATVGKADGHLPSIGSLHPFGDCIEAAAFRRPVRLAIPNSSDALMYHCGSPARAVVDGRWVGDAIATIAMIESAAHAALHTTSNTALHATLNTALHTTLDLSECEGREHKDHCGREDPICRSHFISPPGFPAPRRFA